ncbi:hypothetical protein ACSBR2_026241 [Camellia fascicularis]
MLSCSPEKSPSWSQLWLKNKKALNHVVFAMKLQSLSKPPLTNLTPESDKTLVFDRSKLVSDRTSLLSDELLLRIFSKLPQSQRISIFLVSKRWLNLQGRLVRSLKLLDWNFLISGRLFARFPNLIHVDLVRGCFVSPRNAGGCRRLVKLELSGCEGSYDGIKAIGQCCQMLEELTLTNHRMEGGWLSALSYCENLKTLKFQSCKRIDCSPEPDEQLGSCSTLECLHLERCQLRDKRSVRALFLVCEAAREIVFQNCWGLDNDMFSIAGICRRVKSLSLESCSQLTTQGLEYLILSWKELQRLQVVSCNNIKDSEVTPALSALFSDLQELKWNPDSKSLLLSSFVGSDMRKRGGKFFKKA